MFVRWKAAFRLRPPAPATAPGFTLIECLVALVVIVIGFLAALMLQSKAMEGGNLAANQTTAMILAESKIEEVGTMAVANLPAALQNGGPLTERLDAQGRILAAGAAGGYTRRTVLRFKCPTDRTNEIEVTVSWLNDTRHSVYTTIIPVI